VSRRLPLVPLAAAACGPAVLLWWLSARGTPAPQNASRAAILLAAACLVALAARGAVRLWRAVEEPAGARPGRWLLALLALSFAAHFTGLGHEIGGLYFADEGTFRAQAERINDGQLLRAWFVYPHLLFYLDAVALWVASLFAGQVTAAVRVLCGVEGALEVAGLVTRTVSAGLGALTAWPVFALGRRLGGLAAGVLGGALIVLSPIYLEVCHLAIADGPAAFFAAVSLAAAARLLDGGSRRAFLLAGAAAGLAAGCKYPAGIVAVAIVALDLRLGWRRLRRGERWWPAGTLLAAGAALAAFLLTTPSLLAFPAAAAGEGTAADLLFGARLYAKHGWPGVVRASNIAYYAGELARSFGLPALILGLSGLAAAPPRNRTRVAWILPLPLVYLGLLLVLTIALRRNLTTVLPALAALLGVGLAGWLDRLRRLRPAGRWLRPATALLAAAALAVPAARSGAQLARASRPTTRDLAAEWMIERLPPGTFVVQEAYTPQMPPPPRFFTRKPRLAIRVGLDELRDPRYDYLLLASDAYGRFLRPDRAGDPALQAPRERYRALFDAFEEVAVFEPGRLRAGPVVHVLRLAPEPLEHADAASWTAAAALVSDPAMAESGAAEIRFTAPGQWALFKGWLRGGEYELTAEGQSAGAGSVEIRRRDALPAIEARTTSEEGRSRLTVPGDGKVFLYLRLPPGSRLTGLRLEPLSGAAG
jgi:hypothetical protein